MVDNRSAMNILPKWTLLAIGLTLGILNIATSSSKGLTKVNNATGKNLYHDTFQRNRGFQRIPNDGCQHGFQCFIRSFLDA